MGAAIQIQRGKQRIAGGGENAVVAKRFGLGADRDLTAD